MVRVTVTAPSTDIYSSCNFARHAPVGCVKQTSTVFIRSIKPGTFEASEMFQRLLWEELVTFFTQTQSTLADIRTLESTH